MTYKKYKILFLYFVIIYLVTILSILEFKHISESKASETNTSKVSGFVFNPVDTPALRKDILKMLGKNSKNYAIVVKDLKRDQSIGINETKIFPPASISKIPVALLILRDVDRGKFSLKQSFKLTSASIANPTNDLSYGSIGKKFTLDQYLHYLLIDSDNTSLLKLEQILGGYKVVDKRTKSELGVETFFRLPHDVTAMDMAKVFEGIHNGTYLSENSNKYLLNLMEHTNPTLQDQIPRGVPKGIKIAHKTGHILTDPGYAWNDAGIIYGKKTDYILVFLNQFVNYKEAIVKANKVSRLVYNTLNDDSFDLNLLRRFMLESSDYSVSSTRWY